MVSKERYEQLNLAPSYPLLAQAFGIHHIEEEEDDFFLLQEIRRKITERFEELSNLFDKILHPDQQYIALYESSYLQKQKEIMKDMKLLFKALNAFIHQSNYCEIIAQEEDERSFINHAAAWWQEHQKKLAEIFLMLSQAWQNEEHSSEMQAYFG